MYRVFFKSETSEYILNYFENYRKYYESLFQDSGIWSEDQIIDGYIKEALNRHNELKTLIITTLKEENVLGRKDNNTIIIKWRTKYLFVDFDENDDLKERYVVRVSIR